MFHLVIVVVSIALSIALTVAGAYFLGASASQAPLSGDVEVHYIEAKHISQALQMWRWAHEGQSPEALSSLVSERYLASAPSAAWALSGNTLTVSVADSRLCRALNRRLGQPYESVPACNSVDQTELGVCCTR